MFDYCGQMVKGYEIDERIGAGSFGVVYRAFQPTIGRDVAIKIILPAFANHPSFIRRFEAEAQLVARLEHPHIVPLFDYWREPEAAFLVMRLLPGSLRALLDEGTVNPDDAARLIDQIASALAMSHRQGVIHRDVKPDNILLDGNGNAYLTDFGLAKVTETDRHTDDDHVAGSPAYMAPEQLAGQAITSQTDIYALGVVIYEMFAGDTPYTGLKISDLIAQKLKEPFPSLNLSSTFPTGALNPVIQRATSTDLAERYQDIQDLARDFRRAVMGEAVPVVVSDAAAEAANIDNPYKGLRAFEEADAADFYGREALVNQVLAAMQLAGPYERFLAVVGPSGSGKSSLVRAGLLPALRQGAIPGSEQWFMATMMPGAQPLQQLEAALLSVASHVPGDLALLLRVDRCGLVRAVDRILGANEGDLLLVIDQFEELFTLVTDEALRAHVLALLQTAVTDPGSRVRVVITLRADFYDRPLLYEHFGALMQARTQVVLPLTTTELERAIMAPAQRVGVQIEPNLVAAIIADVHEEPGALPLLQYALTEVFDRRVGRHLSLEEYEEIGRAAGALARRADQVYVQLTPVQQAVVQQVFLRLVTLGEGTEDTRRRVERAELASVVSDTSTLQEVLDIFGRHRLLSFDRVPDTRAPTVEVAHEALLREWARLRSWLDVSREDVRQQRRLARLAKEWNKAGHDPSYLLHGVQLQQYVDWLQHTCVSPGQAERDFMTASIEVRDTQQAQEEARRAREKLLETRARRFLRGLLVMMGIALAVALVLSFLAIDQREEAQAARQAAESNALRAQSEAESAAAAAAVAERRADELQSLSLVEDAENARSEGDIDLALALALEANRITNPPVQAQRVLNTLAPLATVRVLTAHASRVNTVAFSPDGTLALSGGDDGALLWWDVTTGEVVKRLDGQFGRVRSIAFTPDGTQVVCAGDDGVLLVVDVATGEIVHSLIGHTGDVFAVAVSPNGQWIASGGRDQVVLMWNAASGTQVARLGGLMDGHQDRITALAFSPDSTALASGGTDARIIVWDTVTGQAVATLVAHSDQITDVAYAPTDAPGGGLLLSASADGALITWNTERYTVVHRLQGHTERINGLAFSPDGRYAASVAGNPFAAASSDNSMILWDVERAQIVQRYTGHTFQVTDVAFSPDGVHVLTASADAALRLWDVTSEIELARATLEGGGLVAAALMPDDAAGGAPDDSRALVVTADNRLMQVTLDPDALNRRILNTVLTVNTVAVSPDGTQALTASPDHTLTLWDVAAGTTLRILTGHVNSVNAVAFLPGGAQAVSVSRDRQTILWDLMTGQPLRTFETHHTNSIDAVAVSPDGMQILTGSADQSVILWDVATGTALRTLTGHQAGVTSVVFNPNGLWAVSGSQDKTLIIWDLATGQLLLTLGAGGTGHTDWITAVAFSPDGQWVWSGGRDRTVRVWDAASGQLIHTTSGFDASIVLIAPDPTSSVVVIGTTDGRLTWLPASTGALIAWVEANRYVRPLSCEERTQFQLAECDTLGSRSIMPGG